MTIYIELILFEPRRNVIYGMPLFVGADTQLLRQTLSGHGEWWDNPSMWLAGYLPSPKRIELRCSFNDPGGDRYAKRLIPHLRKEWNVEPPPLPREIASVAGKYGAVSTSLEHAWFLQGDEAPKRITASLPDQLIRQCGYWSPCDGAIALDISEMDEKFAAHPSEIIREQMASTTFTETIKTGADNCFHFRLKQSIPKCLSSSEQADITWKNRRPLKGRTGFLIDADLACALDAKNSTETLS